ncbi:MULTISPECIES: hypothetical protein [Salinibaculum]|uniref:hypothetical protein n=1 Tax=Salinibaculum TaxID=2732368 RepID=UPI0030D1F25D
MASHYTATRGRLDRRWKLLLVVGFLGLAGGVRTALDAPAAGYELSLYRATPLLFWGGVAVAFLAALVVGLSSDSGRGRLTAAVLGGSAGIAVVALPVVRGYHFYGQGDALTHLGFARSLVGGTLQPQDLLYPGVHLFSVALNAVTGLALTRSLLLTVVVFFGLFFLFVPLCVREMTDAPGALVVGLFAALLLLPINAVGTHVVAHPSSEAILFAPFLLFIALVGVRLPTRGRLRPSRLGLAFAVVAPTMLFVHSQETLSLLVLFGAILGVQIVFRLFSSTHPIAQHRPLLFETLFLGALWTAWAGGRPRVTSRLEAAYDFVVGGSATSAGGTVAGRSASLTDIGASLGGLFLKLFLAAAVFSAVAGIVMLGSPLGRFDDVFPDHNALNKYLTAAFVPLAAITAVVFVGDFGDHYFRFVGFLMLPVTLVGAAALASGVPALRSRLTTTGRRRLLAVLFALLLPLAVFSLHPSPWIFQDNPQVTDSEMTGYEVAIEHQVPDATFAGPRGGGDRFADAIYGPESSTALAFPGEAIPFTAWTNLTGAYDDGTYVPLRPPDQPRELSLYRGFRYGSDGFRALQTTPGIHRVQSTGGFELYYIGDE